MVYKKPQSGLLWVYTYIVPIWATQGHWDLQSLTGQLAAYAELPCYGLGTYYPLCNIHWGLIQVLG